mmetsp:Transcript_13526/g.46757  ORF Transcript_13526/g.46757 Transcript_13526/m.46757 type:complete len:287 (+) Transcript_13526:140-1000(+)
MCVSPRQASRPFYCCWYPKSGSTALLSLGHGSSLPTTLSWNPLPSPAGSSAKLFRSSAPASNSIPSSSPALFAWRESCLRPTRTCASSFTATSTRFACCVSTLTLYTGPTAARSCAEYIATLPLAAPPSRPLNMFTTTTPPCSRHAAHCLRKPTVPRWRGTSPVWSYASTKTAPAGSSLPAATRSARWRTHLPASPVATVNPPSGGPPFMPSSANATPSCSRATRTTTGSISTHRTSAPRPSAAAMKAGREPAPRPRHRARLGGQAPPPRAAERPSHAAAIVRRYS